MAKVSNEVRLIYALWKKKLDKRRDYLLQGTGESKKFSDLNTREIEGIEFAENRLAKIIYNLEEGQFSKL